MELFRISFSYDAEAERFAETLRIFLRIRRVGCIDEISLAQLRAYRRRNEDQRHAMRSLNFFRSRTYHLREQGIR